MLRRVTLILLSVGAVATLGLVVYAGEPGRASWWLFFLPVWQAVGLLPFLAVARILARRGAAA